MFDSITSKTRRRFVVAGMMSFLLAAGLAFGALENGSGPKPASPAGLPQNETGTAAVDPRNDPDDCLYDPTAPKAMAAVQNGPGQAGSSTAAKSTAKPGYGDTLPAVKPGTPSDNTSGAPSGDAACDLQQDDGTSKSPHDRDTESACPAF